MSTTYRLRFAAVALFAVLPVTLPARATSKEMIQLQTQIQQLQDAVARLQQSNDERMGVLKDLVQQTADSVNRMSLTVGSLQKGLISQQEAASGKSDQLSGQIQSLNDSVDELKARMAKLDTLLQNIQGQQQSTNAILQTLPQPGSQPSGPAATQPVTQPNAIPGPSAIPPLVSNGGTTTTGPRRPTVTPAQPTQSVTDLYRAAYGDYMAAKYALAASEFNDIIKAYPEDTLAGNAYFYLGEIDSKSAKPTSSVKNYDHLLEHYPDNPKIPAAHLHKAEAMLSMKQTDAGVRELRALIQRFPNSPEAAQARTRLNAMGVPIVPHR